VVLTRVLETSLPLAEGKRNELKPRRLPLDEEAKRLWLEFTDHVEKQIGPGGVLEPVRGLANKIPEHAARVAAVLTLIRDIDAEVIAADEMDHAIKLAQYYVLEALRLFGRTRINPNLLLAQKFLDWLRRSWPLNLISLPDVYQRSLNQIKDKATATMIVGILVDHGWLRPVNGPVLVDGVSRRDVWEIVRG
jgi:hypothetical protein